LQLNLLVVLRQNLACEVRCKAGVALVRFASVPLAVIGWGEEANGETAVSGAKQKESLRFKEQEIKLANGVVGQNIDIPSASPVNYHQVISAPDQMPAITVDGKLFLPAADGTAAHGPYRLVMIVPGSLGVAPSHVAHAETLNALGFATFVLDSFGARGVSSTVAKQTQFSFAASAYDVLAAWKVLAARDDIDAGRIGAQGHSRGGSAVLTAATRRFADAVIGPGQGLCAVLPGYPWSGHQFLDPAVGETEVRVLMGDADEWCSPMQVQGHLQAIRLAGGKATMRLFKGAQHSFDRGTAVVHIAEASVSPAAPTTYLANDGAFIHPLEDEPNPELVDRDVMVYSLKAGYGSKGAHLGSNPGEAEAFRDDMIAFWKRVLA
jgi:dienelactone hydrolase